MAKSKRSKVKMAYKAMRRQVMQKKHDEALRKLASTNYVKADLPLPPERTTEEAMPSRTHNGCVLVSTFVPTPAGPKLNIVHGPLAEKKDEPDAPMLQLAPPTRHERKRMDEESEPIAYSKQPYFYPRRRKGRDAIQKTRKFSSRHAQTKESITM